MSCTHVNSLYRSCSEDSKCFICVDCGKEVDTRDVISELRAKVLELEYRLERALREAKSDPTGDY